MKEKMNYWMQWLREGTVHVTKAYPVELLMIIYGCVGCFIIYETDWSPEYYTKFAIAPIFAIVALVINNLAGNSAWRKLYWVCWVPVIPLSMWSGFEGWLTSQSGAITCAILLPLAVLASRRAAINDRFVCDTIIWLRSALLAVIFTNIAAGLCSTILFSTTYIFGLDGAWVNHVYIYILILFDALGAPVLFLIMADSRRNTECKGAGVIDIILNYIVTPALLIYTVILYIYMGKIALLWSLPRGGVAYLVFGFTIFSILVKALQTILLKRIYDWFFKWFSIISLPTQILFWIGVAERTSEYGLTQPRVYLIVCGGLMTLCVLLFLSQRTGRYLYVCLATMATFFVMAYIPGASASRLTLRSQTHHAEHIARELNMLDTDGRLLTDAVTQADTVYAEKYRRLYDALSFIQTHDNVSFARFGIHDADAIFDKMPDSIRSYCLWGHFPDDISDESKFHTFQLNEPTNSVVDIDGVYTKLHSNIGYWEGQNGYIFKNDTLTLYLGSDKPVKKIAGDDILRNQIERCGFVPCRHPDVSDEQLAKLFVYEDDFCRIIFNGIYFEKTDSLPRISNFSINVVMTR